MASTPAALRAQCPDGTPPPCAGRPAVSPTSVAVLSFALLSRDTADAYLGEGLADAISARVSRITRVQVTSRAAVRRLRGAEAMSAAELGRTLRASYLVSGTLLRSGGRLRVTIELVRAAGGTQVWSGQFDRAADDVLAIEAEVAAELATRVAGRLAVAERAALGLGPTRSTEAYDRYLRGRFHFNRQTRESLELSLAYFRAAIALDSEFALAHVAIADTYFWLVDDWMSPREAYPRMQAAVDRALALDSTLARAHTLLGTIRLWYDWDREGAERELRHALALNPLDATAHHYYAFSLQDGAARLGAMREAQALDPLNTTISGELVEFLVNAGLLDEAVAVAEHTLALDSTQFLAWQNLGEAHLAAGRVDAADAAFERLRGLRWARGTADLAGAYAKADRREDAARMVREMESRAGREYVSPKLLADACMAAGDYERALEWLERAVADRSGWLLGVDRDPLYAPLRSDPRFNRLVEALHTRRASN